MFAEKIKEISMERKQQFKRGDPRSLPLMADEIRYMTKSIKHYVYGVGKVLTEANSFLDHGEFQKWIEDNFDFSYNSANNFMNVYACCVNRPELVQTIPLSVLYEITAPKCPDELREHLFENSEYLGQIKNKDIKKILKRYKAGKIDLNSPDIKSLIKYDKSNKRFRKRQKAIEQNMVLLDKLLKDIFSLEKKVKWPIRKEGKRTELTQEQDDKINQIFDDLNDNVNKMRPKSKIVDDPKPRLKLVKTNKK